MGFQIKMGSINQYIRAQIRIGIPRAGLGRLERQKYLPDEMSFSVNYLGANITQVGLNFSRPAAQILGQYYQFIRLGFQGYKAVQYNSMQITQYLHDEIGKMAPFVNYSDHVENPLFIWYMKPDYAKRQNGLYMTCKTN